MKPSPPSQITPSAAVRFPTIVTHAMPRISVKRSAAARLSYQLQRPSLSLSLSVDELSCGIRASRRRLFTARVTNLLADCPVFYPAPIRARRKSVGRTFDSGRCAACSIDSDAGEPRSSSSRRRSRSSSEGRQWRPHGDYNLL